MMEIIYVVLAACGGAFFGICIELMIDTKIIRELQDEVRTLKLKLSQAEKDNKVEVIEINDNRSEPESYFVPF